ncbi:hypothetical protein HNY73_014240 [Argiope bruennichi]|uniref:Uncharacterized protein n=1 Tax=Argiope bruennichi TaxID=94029 RepID=A0A8T0END1_ARGBR|nr:hypothetical protein HNY73_014240 [Argiope bruennichi]
MPPNTVFSQFHTRANCLYHCCWKRGSIRLRYVHVSKGTILTCFDQMTVSQQEIHGTAQQEIQRMSGCPGKNSTEVISILTYFHRNDRSTMDGIRNF